MKNIHYSLRYVAFLDLMGFKNMVTLSSADQNILKNINRALDYLGNMQHENYNGPLPMVDLGKEVTAFSDSVVISYDASIKGGGFYVLMDLIYICNDLLNIGIPVRGGVTVGQLIHDERKCFGPAMIDAYIIESNEAIYPRIIINQKVIDYDLSNPGAANTIKQEAEYLENLMKKDSYDDKIILDYMKQIIEFDYPELYDDYIIRTREFIKINLLRFSNDNNLLSKYEWLKRYYNETITTVYEDPNHLLIN